MVFSSNLNVESMAWRSLLLFATILTLVKGYDSRVRMSTFNVDSRWTQVDMDRICQIEELDKRQQIGIEMRLTLAIA